MPADESQARAAHDPASCGVDGAARRTRLRHPLGHGTTRLASVWISDGTSLMNALKRALLFIGVIHLIVGGQSLAAGEDPESGLLILVVGGLVLGSLWMIRHR